MTLKSLNDRDKRAVGSKKHVTLVGTEVPSAASHTTLHPHDRRLHFFRIIVNSRDLIELCSSCC